MSDVDEEETVPPIVAVKTTTPAAQQPPAAPQKTPAPVPAVEKKQPQEVVTIEDSDEAEPKRKERKKERESRPKKRKRSRYLKLLVPPLLPTYPPSLRQALFCIYLSCFRCSQVPISFFSNLTLSRVTQAFLKLVTKEENWAILFFSRAVLTRKCVMLRIFLGQYSDNA